MGGHERFSRIGGIEPQKNAANGRMRGVPLENFGLDGWANIEPAVVTDLSATVLFTVFRLKGRTWVQGNQSEAINLPKIVTRTLPNRAGTCTGKVKT